MQELFYYGEQYMNEGMPTSNVMKDDFGWEVPDDLVPIHHVSRNLLSILRDWGK